MYALIGLFDEVPKWHGFKGKLFGNYVCKLFFSTAISGITGNIIHRMTSWLVGLCLHFAS